MARVDEAHTRWSGRVSGLYFWRRYLVAGVLLAAGLANLPDEAAPARAGALASLAPWMIAAAVGLLGWTLTRVFCGGRWWVTRDQVVHSLGIVSRHTREFEIAELRDVQVRQGLIERLLNIGSISLSSPERKGTAVVLSGVRAPDEVAAVIREQSPSDSDD